jgi:preprotein translocase subunit SecA
LDKEIEHNIIQTFKALGDKSQDIDLDKEGLRGPSSTWTYLVSDKHFGNWMEMLKGKNIGFAAGAALYAGPFLILWGILDKIKRRKNNAL